VLIAENEPQLSMLFRPIEAGDTAWMPSGTTTSIMRARVALAGRTEAYYSDYRGTPQSSFPRSNGVYLYQGQYYAWQRQVRGNALAGFAPASFRDIRAEPRSGVANSARGSRIHQLAAPGQCRAITAILLLGPNTPLLFQGQEYGASQPFLFFSDHNEQTGRCWSKKDAPSFSSQFPESGKRGRRIHRRADRTSAARSSDASLITANGSGIRNWLALHKDLLRLRKEDPVFRSQRNDTMHGAVLGLEAFLIRFFDRRHGDRLLLVNLGVDLRLHAASEPLLAAPAGTDWDVLWSREDPEIWWFWNSNSAHAETGTIGRFQDISALW
jgi:maltooligosyltrehalose trehalohydrolase